jgi:hypothetical protein
MKAARHVLVAVGVAGLLAAAIAAPSQAGPSRARTAAGGCVSATNIEAIIDDSGSMAGTDPNTLRVKALKLLINTLNPGTFLGAVEFGSAVPPSPAADTIFKPEPVGPNGAAMGTALDAAVMADNGSTDYNAAFAQSDADNPNATARVFLTDGGHNVGTYNNGHVTHRVPTYVIAFSPGVSAPEDQARLQQIASDTGGQYFPLADSSALQAVMNEIGAALTCQSPPQTFTDQLAQGASATHGITISAATKSVQIALSWANPVDAFGISGLKLISHGRTIAKGARAKVRKLKVTRITSATFTVLKVSHLAKGRLSFKVAATRVGSGQPQAVLTTQVSRGGSG